jgi:hypothetical protein
VRYWSSEISRHQACRTCFGAFCHRIEQVQRHDQSSANGSHHDRQQEKRSVSCSTQWPVQLRRSMSPARDVHFLCASSAPLFQTSLFSQPGGSDIIATDQCLCLRFVASFTKCHARLVSFQLHNGFFALTSASSDLRRASLPSQLARSDWLAMVTCHQLPPRLSSQNCPTWVNFCPYRDTAATASDPRHRRFWS